MTDSFPVPSNSRPVMARNLRPLSGVGRAPSDTWMRQRLDGAGPRDLRRRLTGIHAALRRGKAPGGGRCPAAIRWSPSTAPGTIPPAVPAAAAAAAGSAATGRGPGTTRPLGPATVHPDIGEVPPPAPEPIRREDGSTENDCGRNAGRRPVGDLRRERPHMKATVAGDGLSSNGPHGRPSRKGILASCPGGGPATTDRCRLVRGRRTRTDMGEARQEGRRLPEVRMGPRAAAHRREPPPESQHARMRGDRQERRGKEVPVGHRPPARTGHGDARHAVRPPQVGHRERDVPDTGARDPYRSGNGSGHGHSHPADVLPTPAMPAFLTARVRRHRCPLSGRARRRQGRSPCLCGRLREPGRTSAFPDWRTPCRAIAGQRLRRPDPRRSVAAPTTPEPPRSRPSPKLFRPDIRPAIGHAHPEHPADAIPPNRPSAGQRIDWRELL